MEVCCVSVTTTRGPWWKFVVCLLRTGKLGNHISTEIQCCDATARRLDAFLGMKEPEPYYLS